MTLANAQYDALSSTIPVQWEATYRLPCTERD